MIHRKRPGARAEALVLQSRRQVLAMATGLAALALAGAAGLALTAGEAHGQAVAGIVMTDEAKADIARVEAYLNQITTLRARFQQYSEDGGVVFGDIYIRRPGKMRVEYEPPVPVVLVADGMLVTYYDSELDQLNQVPIGQTPAWFLLRKNISLTDGITITELDKRPGALRVTMHQTNEPQAGSVDLIFGDQPLELRQWKIVDGAGKEVRIGLFDVRLGGELPNNLFATPRQRSRGNRS